MSSATCHSELVQSSRFINPCKLGSYPYKRLESPQHFRIFTLFPRIFNRTVATLLGAPTITHIFGSLAHHNISEKPSYECLSYVWGTFEGRNVLWLDDQAIYISDELYKALRNLRYAVEPRYLWVDYICINQDDLLERNQQVQLMFSIFSEAVGVIAYLGDEADGSEDIPRLLNKILDYEKSVKRSRTGRDQVRLVAGPWPPLLQEGWICLVKFMSRPWWRRAWIIQEAIAARKLYLVCGQWLGEAEPLVQALVRAEEGSLSTGQQWSEQTSLADLLVLPHFCAFVTLNFMARRGLCGLHRFRPELRDRTWSLLDLLEGAQQTNSTDPRDKVFALLNLCHDAAELDIKPDYTISVEETFRKVARAIVNAGQGHRLLTNAGISRLSTLSLPSWVPDWSARNKRGFSIVVSDFNLTASDVRSPACSQIEIGTSVDELVVSALALGRIDKLEASCVLRGRRDQELEEANIQSVRAGAVPGAWIEQLGLLRARDKDVYLDKQVSDTKRARESTRGRDYSDTEQQWANRSQLLRLVVTVLTYIRLSTKYSGYRAAEIAWHTLTCNHAARGEVDFAGDLEEHVIAFCESTRYLLDEDFRDEYASMVTDILVQEMPELVDKDLPEMQWTMFRSEYLDQQRRMGVLFETYLFKPCFTLRLAHIDQGYVGMVPVQSQQGDLVVCIRGVQAPMVLRQVSEGKYLLVGIAFVHGFMAGEDWLGELEKTGEWTDFVLV